MNILKIQNDAWARSIAAQASQTFTKSLLSSSLLHWINADEFSGATFVFKLNDAIDQCEQRIILATANVVAGFPSGAALARNNISAENFLAAEFFKSQSLRL
jgi:hypothetical protein